MALTTEEVRTVVRETLDNPPMEKAMQVVALLLIDLIQTPSGAERAASLLRDQGWTCAPPAAAKAAKRKGKG